MSISSPAYSFVQFDQPGADSCCRGFNAMCLPVVNQTDIYFQVISDDGDPGNLSVIRGNDGEGEVVSTQSGFVSAGRDNIYLWKSAIDITGLACNECFQLKIGSVVSNCFRKQCDDCYSSILEYYNVEDYGEFIYCNVDFVNRIRLPLFLSKPQLPELKTVYRKSDGTIRQIKSLITKEYQVQTDYMPEEMHDSLVVALGHGNVNVFSSKYTGGISKAGDYVIDWNDDMCVAPADFKVSMTPFEIKNSNCVVCEEIITPPECIAVAISGTPELPAATIGDPYSYVINLTGDAPFSFDFGGTRPGWMMLAFVGNTIEISGTPDNEGTFDVIINITNCSGNGTATFTGSLTVTNSCVGVGIEGTPTLPDGIVGDPYSYSFSLTGTAPFTLSDIIKPSWMTIAVVGSTIEFTGTPDTEGTAIDVSFRINNCSSDFVDFSDTIDVISLARTLTFYAALSHTTFSQVGAMLNAAIDVDIDLVHIYAQGYASADCSGSVIAGAQIHAITIAAGSTNNSGSVFPSGDWTGANSFTMYNCELVSGLVNDGDVITIGSYSVTIIFDGC